MSHQEKQLPGDWSPMQPIKDPAQMEEMTGFLNQVREAAEVKAGRTFTALEPWECASQVVAGVNYRIKAYTGDGWNSDFGVYQPLDSQTVTLTSYTQIKA